MVDEMNASALAGAIRRLYGDRELRHSTLPDFMQALRDNADLKKLRVVRGELLNPKGDAAISGLTTLDEARPGMASFAVSAKHAEGLEATQASLVLVPPGLDPGERMAVRVEDVWLAVKRLLEYFHPGPRPSGDLLSGRVSRPSAASSALQKISLAKG